MPGAQGLNKTNGFSMPSYTWASFSGSSFLADCHLQVTPLRTFSNCHWLPFYSARALEIPVGATPLLMDLDSFPRWPSPLVHTAERIPTCGGLLIAEAVFINTARSLSSSRSRVYLWGCVCCYSQTFGRARVGRGGKGNCSRKQSESSLEKTFPCISFAFH